MRCRRSFLIFVTFFCVLAAAALAFWTAGTEGQAYYMPDYEKMDLEAILDCEGCELTEDDYRLLFFQTGMTRTGIDELYGTGQQDGLLELQERFFAEAEVECRHTNLFLRSERLVGEEGTGDCGFLPAVQEGDILVTFSGHVFGWRSGHAAVVVNAREGLTLEAITYGCNSGIRSLEHWREYPCFALLRLKGAAEDQRAAIAAYAAEELVDVPYSLFSFTDSDIRGRSGAMGRNEIAEGGEPGVASTQCAHLVWTVYQHFGYDLDSDGGAVVTPADIFHSDLLEVVQIYGISPVDITNF